MFLEYVALGMLIFVALVFFYGVIAIHDIPYEIAKKRNHPHQDVLHIAGWVSLFYPARTLAVPVDLGHPLPRRPWLGDG